MFSTVRDPSRNALLLSRIERLRQQLRQVRFVTRSEGLARVYSEVNAVLAQGAFMTTLRTVRQETPAHVADIQDNLNRLAQDAEGISQELLRLEDEIARVVNFSASSQSSLRQQIRELVYESRSNRFVEAFLHRRQLDKTTASVDFQAGVASLALTGSQDVVPNRLVIGAASAGSLASGSLPDLLDDSVETHIVWDGSRLELRLEFDEPQIVNRLILEQEDFEGLLLQELTSSPDGVLREDLRSELRSEQRVLDGSSGKKSGDYILDFHPRHAREIRIVLSDRIGEERISLRGVKVRQQRYEAASQVQTIPIALVGIVRFDPVESLAEGLTVITHQISYDGVHFQSITSGEEITLDSSPFWYRASLARMEDRFAARSGPLLTDDPSVHLDYVLSESIAVDLGNQILERSLTFDSVTGPIVLRETPLAGTLNVWENGLRLTLNDYTFGNGTITFPSSKTNILVRYQTSALGNSSIERRREFYSPLLYEVRFTQV